MNAKKRNSEQNNTSPDNANHLGMCKADRFAKESPTSKLWREVYIAVIARGNTSGNAHSRADEAIESYKLSMMKCGIS